MCRLDYDRSVCPSICMSGYLYLSVSTYVCLSICLSACVLPVITDSGCVICCLDLSGAQSIVCHDRKTRVTGKWSDRRYKHTIERWQHVLVRYSRQMDGRTDWLTEQSTAGYMERIQLDRSGAFTQSFNYLQSGWWASDQEWAIWEVGGKVGGWVRACSSGSGW